MTDSLIDARQSSKRSATKVAAAFPNKKISKKISIKRLDSTKVESVLSSKIKKEEAADFMEAINEKMKEPQVKKKAEQSVTAAAGNGSSDSVAAGRFRAFVAGFGTGAKDIDRELRQHFQNCGGIQEIRVNDQDGYAYIDFTSLESLLKALQQDKTSFCGRPLARPLNIYRVDTNKSTFRASISRLDTGSQELDVLRHFKICGEIDYIRVRTPGYADIEFASLASLDKALEFNNPIVGDHRVSVLPMISCARRFRVEIRGFDTGAGAEEALRKHFKECGRIEGISVSVKAGYACIDFANRTSLFKALELNNTRVGGHLVTVRQPGDNYCTSEFRAGIGWFGNIDMNDMRSHFEKCGGIAGIRYTGRVSAEIDFTNLDSLNKGLKLHKSSIGNHVISVKKRMLEYQSGGY